MAAKKISRSRKPMYVEKTTLTQKDADKFRVAAREFAKKATVSKKKARETLQSMGIYTPTGRLTRRYG